MPVKQKGVALVLALLIFALATIVAVMIMGRADSEFRRAERLLYGEQALQYVFGAEQWVMQILYRDRRDSTTDHLGEDWAVNLPPLPVDGGVVVGRLEDLSGRFNLNNLVNEDGTASEPHMRQFQRLLQVLGLEEQVSVAAVVDFIDPGSEPTSPDGAEDGVYLTLQPPHRTPNRPLAGLSEIALLRDFDPAVLPILAPHVTALPVRTPLNVNTLSSPLVMSLADGISEPLAEEIVANHADGSAGSLQQFTALLGLEPEPGVGLALSSDWFLLTVRVNIGSMDLTMYSLLERQADGRTRVVSRQRTPW